MSTPLSHAANFFWRATNAVRADGGPTDVVVQSLATVFLLRLLDFDDAEEEAVALFEGRDHAALLPEPLKWDRLANLPPEELVDVVHQELVPYVESPPPQLAQRLVDKRAIVGGFVQLTSPLALHSLFSLVSATPFETPEDRRRAGQLLGDLVARWAEKSKYGGEFSTPPRVAELMSAIAAPKLGERIYDPCFGAANGLVACVERLREEAKFHTPRDWERVQRESIFGVEINPGTHLIGAVRLMLAGIQRPSLVAGDALAREVGRGPHEGFDCVVAVPPWGRAPKDLRERIEHLPFPKAQNLEELFIQHIAESLRPGGRAVVAVPDGVLFRSGSTERLRRWLVEEYCIRLVVLLPQGTFRPYTNVATSLLVFERQPAASSLRVVNLRDRKQLDRDTAEVLEFAFGDASADQVTDVPLTELASRHFQFQAPSPAEDLLDEALQALPKSVRVAPLRELVEEPIRTGVQYRRDYTVDEAPDDEGYVPLVRVGDVGERVVRSPGLWVRVDSLRGDWKQRIVHAGDLVVTSSGTIGRVGLATNGSVGAVASNSVLLVRPTPEVASDYLAGVLRSPTYHDVLQDRTTGAVISHLTAKVLQSILVPIPPLLIQHRISTALREHGGDALAILRTVLAEEGRPLTRFIESSPAIDMVMEADEDDVDRVRESLSACVEKAAPVVGEQLNALGNIQLAMWDDESEEDSADRSLLRWSRRLATWLDHLQGVTLELPTTGISTVQYAQLSASDTAVAECLRTIPSDGSVNAKRARTWLEKSRRLVQALAADIAAHASIALTADAEPRHVDGNTVVSITARNGGLAPLSDVRIAFTRSDGETSTFTHPMLRDGDAIELDVHVITSGTAGPRRLRAEWSARRIDGSRLVGDEDIELLEISSSGQFEELDDLGSSPYIVGNPVDQAGMFYGRADVIQRIRVQVAREGVANVILLEGNRRTGKTSILKRLQDPEVLPGWLPVYCSFQQAAGDAQRLGVPTDDLFRAIGMAVVKTCFKDGIVIPIEGMPEKASKVFRLKLPKIVNRYFREAGGAFQALNALVEASIDAVKPRRLLLMLDEFDKVQEGIDSGVTSPQTPENIRNLYQDHTEMAGILTGSRRIKRLREEYWHALFGFGYRIGVDPLEASDARALVTGPVRGRLQFAPGVVDAVTNATARQPFLIQSVCARIFEQAADSGDQRVTVAAAENAMSALVTDSEHFKTLWQYVGTDRRRYVLWLVHQLQDGEDPVGVDLLSLRLEEASIPLRQDDDVADDLEFLRELELVDQVEDTWKVVYRLTVPLMGRWMKAHIDPDIVKRRAREEEPQGETS